MTTTTDMQGQAAANVMERMRFRLMQGGMEVAGVEGKPLYAMREAMHYLAVYGEDGPCTLQFYTKGKRWRDVREGELENAIDFRLHGIAAQPHAPIVQREVE